MARKAQPLVISHSNEDLLAADAHTRWEIAQERGRNRNGRPYLSGPAVGGHGQTKKGRSRDACRGRVSY
jgi:hypothetical protein